MDVRCDQLRFVRAGTQVLDLPALTFRAGRISVLSGPNGAGKTTLLRLIAGLERPTAGRILIGDQPISPTTRRRIAFSFQEPVFLDRSVRENLELGLALRAVAAPERSQRLAALSAEAGIAHLMERSARTLSGGEAQLVNLVRALSLKSDVTLLDEPLTGLDPEHRSTFVARLPRLLRAHAGTAIVVLHDAEVAAAIADDRVQLGAEGRVA